MTKLPLSSARDDLAATVNAVQYQSERVILTRHGKHVAALVSVDDLELLEMLDDRADLDAIRAALAESDERVSYDDLRAELGLE